MASPIAPLSAHPPSGDCYLHFGVYPYSVHSIFFKLWVILYIYFSQYVVNIFPYIFQHILSTPVFCWPSILSYRCFIHFFQTPFVGQ